MAVVGRARESALLIERARASVDQSTVTTLVGPAGIGKSTLIDETTAMVTREGFAVLACRPTVSEQNLAYAALTDLIEPIDDLSGIPEPQRSALQRALLRAHPESSPGMYTDGEASAEPRLIGMACVALWHALAAQRPLAIVIDDAQWLDPATAAALAFSSRRLPRRNVAVFIGRRSGPAGAGAPRFPGHEMPVRALSPAALRTVVRTAEVGGPATLSSRRRDEIVRAAAGNPLFAIELTRHELTRHELTRHELTRADRHDAVLGVPDSVDALIGVRIRELPVPTQHALAGLALSARPSLAVVRALGWHDVVERSEADGMLDTSTGRVVFAHPLFATAALASTTATERRALHRSLSDVVTDPTERLRHLALAAEGPDEPLADALLTAAHDLAARAAVDLAAEFAQLSVRLSHDPSPALTARLAAAAHLSYRCGETDMALELFDRIDPSQLTSPERVDHHLDVARATYARSDRLAHRAGLEALSHCTTDLERITVHSLLAWVSSSDVAMAVEHGRLALELAEHTPVPRRTLAMCLAGFAGSNLQAGNGLDREMFMRAIECENGLDIFPPESAFASLAVLLRVIDEPDESRAMLQSLLTTHVNAGAEPYLLSHLPLLELSVGDLDAAEDAAQRHLEAAEHTAQDDQVFQARYNLATVEVYRGDAERARSVGAELTDAGRNTDDTWTERNGWGLLGLAELTTGNAAVSAAHLRRWAALGDTMHLREPGYCRYFVDFAEALVALGELDEADIVVARLKNDALLHDRPVVRGWALRAAALVAAARGEQATAISDAERAVSALADTAFVIEQARAQLTLGQIKRRFKDKAGARAALEPALATFERVGAEGFAKRARLDLARVSNRAASNVALTETERRVAELAATGQTVRQIGDALFISSKTVEANLTRVYRKLGISGRVALAEWLRTQRSI